MLRDWQESVAESKSYESEAVEVGLHEARARREPWKERGSHMIHSSAQVKQVCL